MVLFFDISTKCCLLCVMLIVSAVSQKTSIPTKARRNAIFQDTKKIYDVHRQMFEKLWEEFQTSKGSHEHSLALKK